MNEKKTFRRSDFHFDLPDELIAQEPAAERDASRLMVLYRRDGRIEHRNFSNIDAYMAPGDVLVMNNAKVMPARVFFRRTTGGLVEMMLSRRGEGGRWLVISNRTGRLGRGEVLTADRDPGIRVTIVGRIGDYLEIEAEPELTEGLLERIGSVPLPPYIRRDPGPKDRVRYQTVYAKESGSAAAPTAGFHFSPELLRNLGARGVETVFLTLDVSWGTFQPVRHEDLGLHTMHRETYHLPEGTADRVNRARREKRRVIAVGTTSLRVLESTFSGGVNVPGRGETGIFLHPPMEVRSIDGMLTNFHTPFSTLLMLVSAFGGYDRIMNAYRAAVEARYRFFSYGDAMLIV
ncbi:MAG TPA: tRNA preQ1(34) S-adenosylmethionine ribosyltransferase-isomerase QueA [Spirochaetes bacterium]|nr:tRNA preQ1(34) S-adenosylmethionine ribosyltransferase-isomerase QueA [Spirochaetota bacterium]